MLQRGPPAALDRAEWPRGGHGSRCRPAACGAIVLAGMLKPLAALVGLADARTAEGRTMCTVIGVLSAVMDEPAVRCATQTRAQCTDTSPSVPNLPHPLALAHGTTERERAVGAFADGSVTAAGARAAGASRRASRARIARAPQAARNGGTERRRTRVASSPIRRGPRDRDALSLAQFSASRRHGIDACRANGGGG